MKIQFIIIGIQCNFQWKIDVIDKKRKKVEVGRGSLFRFDNCSIDS